MTGIWIYLIHLLKEPAVRELLLASLNDIIRKSVQGGHSFLQVPLLPQLEKLLQLPERVAEASEGASTGSLVALCHRNVWQRGSQAAQVHSKCNSHGGVQCHSGHKLLAHTFQSTYRHVQSQVIYETDLNVVYTS